MNLEGTPTAPVTVRCTVCGVWIMRGTTCQRCWPGHPHPVPEGEHSQADAPPSTIEATLAKLPPNAQAALKRYHAQTAPAMPLELAAADALAIAEDALLGVRDGTASYTDLAGSLERIVAILRGGLGDDHDDAA